MRGIRFEVRMTDLEHKALETLADDEGLSQGEIVRLLIKGECQRRGYGPLGMLTELRKQTVSPAAAQLMVNDGISEEIQRGSVKERSLQVQQQQG